MRSSICMRTRQVRLPTVRNGGETPSHGNSLAQTSPRSPHTGNAGAVPRRECVMKPENLGLVSRTSVGVRPSCPRNMSAQHTGSSGKTFYPEHPEQTTSIGERLLASIIATFGAHTHSPTPTPHLSALRCLLPSRHCAFRGVRFQLTASAYPRSRKASAGAQIIRQIS